MFYPVLIPTMNRFGHFKKCVESLSRCTHSDKTELVIGLDYPPSEEYIDGWTRIKEYIPSIKGFKKVTILEAKKNLGFNDNIKELNKYADERYDARIITEDDNVFSPCFLDYMNKSLNKYKDDESILAVSGYLIPIKWTKETTATVFRCYDFPAWGIGVYRDKWFSLDETMPPHYMKYVCSNKKLLLRLKDFPRDLYQLVFWTKDNPKLDCRNDFTIACYNLINNKYVICPTYSLVRNEGHDGSGINCNEMKNDYLGKQEISKEYTFDLKDTLSEKEQNLYLSDWIKKRNNMPYDKFSCKMYFMSKATYWLLMMFGYSVTMRIIDFAQLIRRSVRK